VLTHEQLRSMRRDGIVIEGLEPPTDVGRVVAGVDGCRGGWVVAIVDAAGSDAPPCTPPCVRVVARFADVLALRPRPVAVAVDMPIGLPGAGPRACDLQARARLGPRRASVFPAPVRAVLAATTYADALRLARAADGRGISRQTYNLLPRIREVDGTIGPAQQAWVVEAHPELAFALLAGGPCAASKHTPAGRAERIALLATTCPGVAGVVAAPPRGARPDDVLDALALTVTARRVAARTAIVLGDGAVDARGLRMAIVT